MVGLVWSFLMHGSRSQKVPPTDILLGQVVSWVQSIDWYCDASMSSKWVWIPPTIENLLILQFLISNFYLDIYTWYIPTDAFALKLIMNRDIMYQVVSCRTNRANSQNLTDNATFLTSHYGGSWFFDNDRQYLLMMVGITVALVVLSFVKTWFFTAVS